jgi:hypothetical protein
MQAGKREFIRLVNASADTILDLQWVFDGKAQPMQVVAIDGVPVNSQDGPQPGSLISVKDFLAAAGGARRVHRFGAFAFGSGRTTGDAWH